ncbi:uncharacterized protein [Coffea arabica]|uniref:Uncharacterized protein isoform X2 n=1 Tax=Coffea arabica TaxID=13443 RepID=A0A6P6WLN3_COFAR
MKTKENVESEEVNIYPKQHVIAPEKKDEFGGLGGENHEGEGKSDLGPVEKVTALEKKNEFVDLVGEQQEHNWGPEVKSDLGQVKKINASDKKVESVDLVGEQQEQNHESEVKSYLEQVETISASEKKVQYVGLVAQQHEQNCEGEVKSELEQARIGSAKKGELEGLDDEHLNQNRERDEEVFYLRQVSSLIADDNKDELVGLLKEKLERNVSGISSLKLESLLTMVCQCRAKSCATALVAGEAGLKLDLHAKLSSGEYPLHVAAHNLSFELVNLFLQLGAQTNVVGSSGKLPLHMAVEAISRHDFLADWIPEKSIHKLIYLLCLPDLHKPLEVVNLLAQSSGEVQSVAKHCVEDGNLVQIATLLMGAREKLLEPVPGYETEGPILGLYIAKKLRSLTCEEFRLIAYGKREEIRPFRSKKDALLSAVSLLQVFESAGGAIEDYCHSNTRSSLNNKVAKDIHCLLWKFGFLGSREHINSCLSNLGKLEKAKLIQSVNLTRSLPELVRESRKAGSQLTPRVYSPPNQSFHSCTWANTAKGVKLVSPVRTQADGIINQAMKPLMRKFKTAAQMSVMGLSMRRRIRY